MTNTSQKYLIISNDGGGIRGLITALLLSQLSSDFLDQAYLFTGTSTGGIIALGLASGVPVSRIVHLYKHKGADIFQSSPCRSGLSGAALQPPDLNQLCELAAKNDAESWANFFINFIGDIVCVKYGNSGLKSRLEAILGDSANQPLQALKRCVAVTTFQLSSQKGPWAPLTLHNIPGINPPVDTTVIDAALSTSAAPTYFPPYLHPSFGFCADGGLFANNPSTLAVTTLIQSGVSIENIWLLSLGTGNTVNSIPFAVAEPLVLLSIFGPLAWLFPWATSVLGAYTPAVPLLSALFDGASAIDGYQTSQLLGRRYQRAEVPLKAPVALDDFSHGAIQNMESSVTDYLKTQEWKNILSWIKENFGPGK